MNLRMRMASTLAMMLGALSGSSEIPFDPTPASRGPMRKRERGTLFWPRSPRRRGQLDSNAPAEGTYNVGINAQKRARRALERHLRAEAVAAAGGKHLPKHRSALAFSL